jgi:prepilin peptidase CpaA
MLQMPPLPIEVVALVGTFVGAAAVIDYRQHRIPNYLTVPAAVLGLLYSFLSGWIGPVSAISGFFLGFSLLLLPWILGGGGMGDVKLLAALGTWLGPVYILFAFVGAIFVAAFLAMGIMAYTALSVGIAGTKEQYLATAGMNSNLPANKTKTKAKRVLPFAVPIAISTGLLMAWLMLRNG